MPKFEKGDKVWYVPDHAEDATHRDAEAGVVVQVSPVESGHYPGEYHYKVNYNDGSGIAKLTYERHLEPRKE